MKKGFTVSLLAAILISGCGQAVQTTDKDLSSAVKLSGEDIAVFDKEYSFKTKALTANYIKSKLKAFIGSDNGAANAVKIVKELEYARYKDETVIPFKAMMAADHDFYTTMTGVEAVILRRSQSPAFDQFISEANPAAPSVPENIIYVNANLTTGNDDGTSWENAYRGVLGLQNALTNTAAGNIWVAAGTYKPTTGTNRRISFQLKEKVNIYGGFAGNETSLTERNFNSNVVILSGDINNTGTASIGDSYHVVVGADDAILDGVTIKFGYADGVIPTSGVGPNDRGGGMYNYSVAPKLENVNFSNNLALITGGGIYHYSSLLTMKNVTVSNNKAKYGGGLYNYSSSSNFENVTFSNNTANEDGGGIYNVQSSSPPTLNNVTFSNNSAGSKGGGIYNAQSSPTLNNVIFSGNSAWGGGGIFNIYSSSPTLTNVTFFNNNSASNGGAMASGESSSPTVKNTIFWGSSSSYLINQGGGTLKIGNSIIEGGRNHGIYGSYILKSLDDVTLDGSTFYSVGNNLASNPLFISSVNLALQPGSPAINAGTNVGAPAADIVGTTRPKGDAPDIGAYEFVE